MNDSIRILTRQIRRCQDILHNDKSMVGTLAWKLRDDLASASRALMMKDVHEMNHMIAMLKGYGEKEGGQAK